MAQTVGEILVDVKAKMSTMQKQLKKIEKKSSDAGKKSGSKFSEGFNNALKRFLSVAAILAILRKVTKAVQELVRASAAQEEIFKKLQTAIESTGTSYKGVSGRVTQFLAEMQKTTRFGDTDMAPALQMIIQLTGDVESGFKGARIAADIASSGLFDLRTASRYVAMAMSGEVTMLGRYIPALKEAALKQAGIVTQSEKIAYAMDILETKFGGAAQKDLDTYAGNMNQFGNYLGDVKERIGDIIKDEFNKELSGWNEALQTMIEAGYLEDFAKLIERAATAIKLMGKLQTGVGAAILNKILGIEDLKLANDVLETAKEMSKELEQAKAPQPVIPQAIGTPGMAGGMRTQADYRELTRFGASDVGAMPEEDNGIYPDAQAQADMEKFGLVASTFDDAFSAAAQSVMTKFNAMWEDMFGEANSVFEKMAQSFVSTMMTAVSQVAARIAASKFLAMLFPAAGAGAGAFSFFKGLLGGATGGTFQNGKKVSPYMGMAGGGSFTVPNGFPKDSFPMMVQSGEKVRVTPSGRAGDESRMLSSISEGIMALNKNMAERGQGVNVSAEQRIDSRGLYLSVKQSEKSEARYR